MNKPTEEFLKLMVTAFYELPGNGAGGCLHIALDDGNLEDSSVQWCKEYATKENDTDAVFMADVLLLYAEEEREKILSYDSLPPYER